MEHVLAYVSPDQGLPLTKLGARAENDQTGVSTWGKISWGNDGKMRLRQVLRQMMRSSG